MAERPIAGAQGTVSFPASSVVSVDYERGWHDYSDLYSYQRYITSDRITPSYYTITTTGPVTVHDIVISYDPRTPKPKLTQGPRVKRSLTLFEDNTGKLRAIALGFRQHDETAITEWMDYGRSALVLDVDPNEVDVKWLRQDTE